MLERPPRGSEWAAWLRVTLWAGLIFATVPLARLIESLVVEHASRDLFLVAVLTVVGLTTWTVGRRLWRGGRRAGLGVVIGVAAGYAALSLALRRNAEEAMHFVEYGVLGVLAFDAASRRTRDASVYLLAGLVGGVVGLLDEALQWAVPGRVWDLRDLSLNLLGASGVQLALAFGLAPPWIEPGFRRAGLARLCRAATLALALLAASLLNTPSRIAAYSRQLPGLGFLAADGSVMLEYGHLFDQPGIGRFRSRFTLEELAVLDGQRGFEAGRLLFEHGDDADYVDFLRRFNPLTDPFLHEARVHLFRRDRYLETGDLHRDEGDLRWASGDWTVAWRENLILERHFGETLARSGRSLDTEVRSRLEASERTGSEYESGVSRSLVTRVSEAQVAAGLALGVVGLGALAWQLGRGDPLPIRNRAHS